MYYSASLYIEKDGSLTDSLAVYQSCNYAAALTVASKWYYLNKNRIYLLSFFEEEAGATVEHWECYTLNPTTGTLKQTSKEVFLQN